MRSLVQPSVVRSAFLATVGTTLACGPRLLSWQDRNHHLWLIGLTLAWAAFFLWSFVFGWHSRCTGRPILRIVRTPSLWLMATACGVVGGLVLFGLIDPVLRAATPGDYPDSIQSWLAMTLFVLAFDQLFLCFAPLAFFARLIHSTETAAALTVAFGIFLVVLKLESASTHFPGYFITGLVAWRILAGSLSVFFYLRGGVWLTWWWILLLQLRHLFSLA